MFFASEMATRVSRLLCMRFSPIRLSLRGFLMLIAAFCVWAAYHGRWIRDREQARQWIVAHQWAADWANADPSTVRIGRWVNGGQVWITADEVVSSLPWSLRLLGERPAYFIHIDAAKLRLEDVQRISSLQGLFPEADGIHVQNARSCDRWPPLDMEAFLRDLPSGAAAPPVGRP